jgi:general secretion pathway protein D
LNNNNNHRGAIRAGLLALLLQFFASVAMAAEEPTWTLNFNETEIGELIRFVAEATGKTMIIDPAVSGRVQVISSSPVGTDALYDMFLSILDVHGYVAVESGNVVRILPVQVATMAPVPVSLGARPGTGSDLVTSVIQLNNVSAVQLVPVLRPLAAPAGQMTAYAASNSIIVTDTAANVSRISEIAAYIDDATVPVTEIVSLDNASAEQVATLLEALRGDEAVPSETPVQIVADARTNSLLLSGKQSQIQRLLPLIARLDSPLTRTGKVNVVYLQYARAESLAPVLTRILRSNTFASAETQEQTLEGATIQADAETNALIITADGDLMQELRNVIARLDIRRAQVLVEAIIVELSGERGEELGVQWLFLNDNGAYGSSGTGVGTSAAIVGAALGAGADGAVDIRGPLAQALANTPGQVLGVGRLDDDLSFNALIRALQAEDAANILSTPSLLTLDNEEAVITVGRNVPFITGSFTSTGNNSSNPDNPFQTIERQNVGVTLRVTPHINEGDSLVLELSQEVSSLLGSGSVLLNGNPITNERLITTTVLTDNGQTVVLGGLIEDSVNESRQRVPLLGDIPGLGRLFRSESTTRSKTHLMVFLRATIMREARELEAATAEKYRFIRNQQLEQAAAGGGVSSGNYPLLPEWELMLRELVNEQDPAADGE